MESTRHGLAAFALLSFALAFFGARVFAIANPDVLIASGGIRFHHFWYGLGMVLVAGWLGIAEGLSAYRRIYALIFGLGAGLIADEVGLLLTFGNYLSEPTILVFIAAFCVAGVGILLLGFPEKVRHDLIELRFHERILYIGVAIAGMSAILFAAGLLFLGILVLAIGIITIIITGPALRRAG